MLRLAFRTGDCQAGNSRPVASLGLPDLVALEIAAARTAAAASQPPRLIIEMNRGNPTWGEERIANELT